ncbi:hypothetical protein ACFW1A_36530 [Kitasatospora sp. NPDC058965]|uniref:hypothetical protein n=1 Tax=Kitasatospora sp. NPDC058965 TaxID=3346682 RepID=UPI003677F685
MVLTACAVDGADTVLLCTTVTANEADVRAGGARATADTWLGPAAGLADTARVLLLPDQMTPDPEAGDPLAGNVYRPPSVPLPGARLRVS